jgi:hypothetical protein
MTEFLTFYALKGVEILVVVLIVSAVVALIEKMMGVDPTPNFDRIQRQHEAEFEAAIHPPVAPRSPDHL